MRRQRRKQNKSTHCAAAAFADVSTSNTLIPKTHNKQHVIEVFVSERLQYKFGNLRRETQARKPLEKEKYETWFHDEKSDLHMAEVSFLIAKTAMRKRNLRHLKDSTQNYYCA